MTVTTRRMGEGGYWQRYLLTGKTIDTVTGCASKPGTLWIALLPIGKKGTDNMIANRELFNAVTNRNNLTRSIRHRDSLFIGWCCTADNAQIVIIQRTGKNAYGDFTWFWLAGFTRSNNNVVKTATGLNINRLDIHAFSKFSGCILLLTVN